MHRFADLASRTLRKSDLLARYGGEEFVVLFPSADNDECLAALGRVQRAFDEETFAFSPTLRCSFSAGLVAYQNGEDAQALIQRADSALYRAKHAGRKQVVVG